jgi:protein tyrosine kinase modulator
LARKEAATMGVGVQDTGGAQFRVIDPPRVSQEPVPPTRLSLLGMALAISLVSGLAASFLANEIVPTIADARSLRQVTQRPVLGMVSMLVNDASRRSARRRSLQFAGGLGALAAAFAGAFALVLMITRVA